MEGERWGKDEGREALVPESERKWMEVEGEEHVFP